MNGASIKNVRTRGEGDLSNADATVNFACKRSYIANTEGGGLKIGQILRTSFMRAPNNFALILMKLHLIGY